MKNSSKKEMLLIKQPAKLIKIYLRQLSVSPKKSVLTKDTPIQIGHKEKMDCYERNDW